MEFVPAGEFIGEKHQVRTVEIAASPQLPDGEYEFVDTYCTDPTCDCRKTMIQVVHDGEIVSVVNYGWESPSYYEEWMGSSAGEEARKMSGASIDISSPNKVPPEGMLALFNALLNDRWIGLFKSHYKAVKSEVEGE